MSVFDSEKKIDRWDGVSYFCTFAALMVFLVGSWFAWSLGFFLKVIVATLILCVFGIVAEIRIRMLRKKDSA